jgi:hypothetical protein
MNSATRVRKIILIAAYFSFLGLNVAMSHSQLQV